MPWKVWYVTIRALARRGLPWASVPRTPVLEINVPGEDSVQVRGVFVLSPRYTTVYRSAMSHPSADSPTPAQLDTAFLHLWTTREIRSFAPHPILDALVAANRAVVEVAPPALRPTGTTERTWVYRPHPSADVMIVPFPDPTPPASPTPEVAEVPFDVYTQVDHRVGVILSAAAIPKKKKLLDLSIDLGEATPRRIISGLALARKPEELIGLRVLVVTNLPPRDFGGGLISRGMILAASYGDDLALVTVDRPARAGTRAT